MTATCDGRVMIVDQPNPGDTWVYVFTVEGRQLTKFNIDIRRDYYDCIACHPTSEHVVVAGCGSQGHLRLAIYTANGEYIQNIPLNEVVTNSKPDSGVQAISVTMESHIAVCFIDNRGKHKVIVVLNQGHPATTFCKVSFSEKQILPRIFCYLIFEHG